MILNTLLIMYSAVRLVRNKCLKQMREMTNYRGHAQRSGGLLKQLYHQHLHKIIHFLNFVTFVLICVFLSLTITAYLEFKIMLLSRRLSHLDGLDIKNCAWCF